MNNEIAWKQRLSSLYHQHTAIAARWVIICWINEWILVILEFFPGCLATKSSAQNKERSQPGQYFFSCHFSTFFSSSQNFRTDCSFTHLLILLNCLHFYTQSTLSTHQAYYLVSSYRVSGTRGGASPHPDWAGRWQVLGNCMSIDHQQLSALCDSQQLSSTTQLSHLWVLHVPAYPQDGTSMYQRVPRMEPQASESPTSSEGLLSK